MVSSTTKQSEVKQYTYSTSDLLHPHLSEIEVTSEPDLVQCLVLISAGNDADLGLYSTMALAFYDDHNTKHMGRIQCCKQYSVGSD